VPSHQLLDYRELLAAKVIETEDLAQLA